MKSHITEQQSQAVNPYREHSADMIRKLEMAGLGYHIDADKTRDTIGKIPLRRLVYREVQLNLTPEIEVFHMLFDSLRMSCLKVSTKRNIKYFYFRS